MFRSAIISDWRVRAGTTGAGLPSLGSNQLTHPIACETTEPSVQRRRDLDRTGTQRLIDLIVPRAAMRAQGVEPEAGARVTFAPIAGGDSITADIASVRDDLDLGADVQMTVRVVVDGVAPAGEGGS